MAVLSRDKLQEKINSFEYWHYPFDLGNGIVITPSRKEYLKKKPALLNFIWPVALELFGGSLDGLRVLDVGCNAGFWSLEAHRSGASYVLGIDPRERHIQQAELVRDALSIDPKRVQYRPMSIYDLSRSSVGEYDLVLLLRVLNHLANPLLALERVREVCADSLVVDIKLFHHDQPVLYLCPEERDRPLCGNDHTVGLRPSLKGVEVMLACSGFTELKYIPPGAPLDRAYFQQRRAIFTARVAR